MKRVLLPIESSRGSGRALLRGIVKYSKMHGPWSFYWKPSGLEEILPQIQHLHVDGIITRDSAQIHRILKLKIPTIVVRHNQKEMEGQINIITDSRAIGKFAAEHFIERGLKYFAFCGFDDMTWSKARCQEFTKWIQKDGFEVKVYRQPAKCDHLILEDEFDALSEWIAHLPKPIGIMACNDDRSHHLVQVCQSLGCEIPDQVAVIGVDNDDLVCELSDPPLSSVELDFERAGFEAAARLDLWMNEKTYPGENIVVPATQVVSRKSTDITALEDREVACVIEFIRRNVSRPLTVQDIVIQVPISRRMLERRFKKCMNRTIHDEIRRVKTNLIAQMLIETNYSILEIALSLGFSGIEHISRYFKSERGMSLRQFRRQYGQK